MLSFLSLYATLIKSLEPGLWGQLNMLQFVLSGTSPKRLQDRRAMGERKEAGNFNYSIITSNAAEDSGRNRRFSLMIRVWNFAM